MKRIALAGIAALTLAVAACGGSSGSSSAPPSGSPTGKVTIQFWHAQTDIDAKVMQQIVNSFNASHPNIVVQASSGGTSTGDLLPKVTTALAAGTAPDVAYIFGSYAANIAQSDKTVNRRTSSTRRDTTGTTSTRRPSRSCRPEARSSGSPPS